MYLPITTLATVALSLIMISLALRVVGFRRSEKVSLGDGGKQTCNAPCAVRQISSSIHPLR